MDAADRVAMLERATVIRWRSQNGLVDDADFAYYFDTAAQAFNEAGYAVQNEWVRVRQQVSGSASAAVLDLVLQEIRAENAARKSKAAPAPPAAKVATRRMGRLYPPRGTAWLKRGGSLRVPRPPQRVKPEPVDLADANAPNLAALIGCVLEASAIGLDPAGPAAQEDAVRPVMENLVQGTEVATVSGAVNTWRELQAWCAGREVAPRDLTAVNLSGFMAQHPAPTRARPSLEWLSRNLNLGWDLSLCVKLRGSGGTFGTAAQQAPVAMPAMVWQLETSILNAIQAGNPLWLGLFVFWIMAFGVVRWAHTRRSRLLSVNQHSMLFMCSRGKQKRQRHGFLWSVPRFAATNGCDLGREFCMALYEHKRHRGLDVIGFEANTGRELSMAEQMAVMRQAMEPVVRPEDLGSITTKSWRQVGPTWAALTDLNATDLCALSNWQEKGEVKEATPLRYHRAKTLHAQALKLCLRDAVGIMKANAEASWQEVSPAELRRQFPLDLRKTAEVIGERDKFIFKQVGAGEEKSVRLRSGVSRWAPAAFRPAEPETGASPASSGASGAAASLPAEPRPKSAFADLAPKRKPVQTKKRPTPPERPLANRPEERDEEYFDRLARTRWIPAGTAILSLLQWCTTMCQARRCLWSLWGPPL